jgi:hypothetical protein
MTDLDRPYLEKQVKLFLNAESLERKNDLLYRIGTNADVLTPEDINHIHRDGGWLTQYQRQQVVNFISEILEIELDNWLDFSKENQVDMTLADSNLTNASDLKIVEALVSEGVAEVDALQVTSLLNKMPRTLEEQDLVNNSWKQINKIESWEEFSAFKTLVQKGISEEDALLAAPLVYKNPRSPQEQAIITKVWKQLIDIKEGDRISFDPDLSFKTDLNLAIQGFAEGKPLAQIKQDIKASSKNFNVTKIPSAPMRALAQKIQYLDLVCTEAQAVFKSLSEMEIKK